MFASAPLLLLLAQLDARPDEATLDRGPAALSLEWRDAEDRLDATLTPTSPVAGMPLEVIVHVGSFDGAAFDGPVRINLRSINATMGQSVTVTREAGKPAWRATLTPQEPGTATIEFGFRTTRYKLVHATFEVVPPGLPRWPWYVVIGLGTAGALAFGVRAVLRRSAGDA